MKHFKGVLFITWLAILVLTVVFGQVFADYAKTKFWWVAWDWASGISAALFIVSVIWYTRSRKDW